MTRSPQVDGIQFFAHRYESETEPQAIDEENENYQIYCRMKNRGLPDAKAVKSMSCRDRRWYESACNANEKLRFQD